MMKMIARSYTMLFRWKEKMKSRFHCEVGNESMVVWTSDARGEGLAGGPEMQNRPFYVGIASLHLAQQWQQA